MLFNNLELTNIKRDEIGTYLATVDDNNIF